MNVLAMALRNLRTRPLASVLTALSVALGVGLVASVGILEREARAGFARTAGAIDVLVAGTKGSRIDALLATLFHVGRAPGRVPLSYVDELRADKRVAWALPLAYGDRYRGAPVVGTTAELFVVLEPRPGRRFVVDGAVFAPGSHEAVVGAAVSARLGLAVGDEFFPSHSGADEDHTHAHEHFRVVGIAQPTGTAFDRALWVDVAAFLSLRGHGGLAREGRTVPAVSAALLKATSRSPLVLEPLLRRINDGTQAQALRPARVAGELMGLFGDAYRVLRWIGGLVLLVAALSVVVSLYNTMAERRHEIAILRALGATRTRVLTTILLEAACLCALGAALGLLLAHGATALLAPLVAARTGVALQHAFVPGELALVGLLFAVGCVAGLIPAVRAYRTDVANGLTARAG